MSDFKSTLYETTTNVSDFFNFENLSFEGLTESLSDAILGTEAWDSDGDQAVASAEQDSEGGRDQWRYAEQRRQQERN